MRLLHTAARTRAVFDDPNLVSHAGLVPAVRLASDAGLQELVTEHLHVAAKTGANPGLKAGSLVAGMIAGADSLDGMDLLRHGAIPATVGGIRAPSTLGSFLRAFTHGHVRQLAAVHRRVLARLPGPPGVIVVRADSASYAGAFVAACRRGGAHFSVTTSPPAPPAADKTRSPGTYPNNGPSTTPGTITQNSDGGSRLRVT